MSQKVAQSSASILITGESGTGKEVFAKAIHEASGRLGNFVVINCGAIPGQLLESEIFGYVEGAFTGAIKKGKTGKFEFANKGTLFLDEIGDMPMEMQVKLLRVLQDGVVYRLGSEKGIITDTRIIAATNRDLKQLMKESKFRDDLYYRFAVVSNRVTSSKGTKRRYKGIGNAIYKSNSKKEDMEIISIDERIYPLLFHCPWEGNIRELKNVIQRMIVLSTEGKITLDSVPEYILNNLEYKEMVPTDIGDKEDNDVGKYDLVNILGNIEKRP